MWGIMRLHALSGRPEQALAQYELLRDTLFRGLGAEPSATTRRLRDEIVAGRLRSTPPAAPPPEEELPGTARHNLPARGPASWGVSARWWRSGGRSP